MVSLGLYWHPLVELWDVIWDSILESVFGLIDRCQSFRQSAHRVWGFRGYGSGHEGLVGGSFFFEVCWHCFLSLSCEPQSKLVEGSYIGDYAGE